MIFRQLLSFTIAGASLVADCTSTHYPGVHPALTKNGGCEDDDAGLRGDSVWKNYNCANSISYCGSYPRVYLYCPFTCGLCSRDNDAGLQSLWGSLYTCQYSESYGYCTSEDKMKRYCPQTCGFVAHLLHENESCLNHCHNRSGPCTWCGSGKCCRKGYQHGEGDCLPGEGGDSQHICIADSTLCRVRYGDEIIIQSQRNNYGNRKMLERDVTPALTEQEDRIENKAAVWKIWNTAKAGEGCVSYGDEIIIENRYDHSFPSYYMLERDEVPSFTIQPDRITNEAAVWKILKKSGNGKGCISYGDNIVLQNQYPLHLEGAGYNTALDDNHHMLAADSTGLTFTDAAADIRSNAAVWQILDTTQKVPSCAANTNYPCTGNHATRVSSLNNAIFFYGLPPSIPGQQVSASNLQQVYVRMRGMEANHYCALGIRFGLHSDLYIWGLSPGNLENTDVHDTNVWRTVKMSGRSPAQGHTFTESSEAGMKFWNPMGAVKSGICEIVFTAPRSLDGDRGILFETVADLRTHRQHGHGRRRLDNISSTNVPLPPSKPIGIVPRPPTQGAEPSSQPPATCASFSCADVNNGWQHAEDKLTKLCNDNGVNGCDAVYCCNDSGEHSFFVPSVRFPGEQGYVAQTLTSDASPPPDTRTTTTNSAASKYSLGIVLGSLFVMVV